jgi:hypothetical protein
VGCWLPPVEILSYPLDMVNQRWILQPLETADIQAIGQQQIIQPGFQLQQLTLG